MVFSMQALMSLWELICGKTQQLHINIIFLIHIIRHSFPRNAYSSSHIRIPFSFRSIFVSVCECSVMSRMKSRITSA